MHREEHGWTSAALGRPMRLLWYGHAGRPILAFPTSMGHAGQNEDLGLIGGLGDKIGRGEVQFCCVDAIDEETWYNRTIPVVDRVRRHDLYDRFLAQEVIPFVRDKAQREDVVAYGASFGGYHAANFALRHPEMISRLIAFSGVFDVHRFLDGFWDDLCYFHCPSAYVANFPSEWVARVNRMGIVLATGEHDHLANETRSFSDLLRRKGIAVHAELWPGVFGHDWHFWIDNLRRFVP
ncbi:MAG TPA: alpha/beta hydrolase-fold protein [Candidatus Polarisedimenticolia bacterium]|nr:alpha/beta hydrolase-fold protein [Candidatus Polarisedimenticolia bacterium]